MAEGVKSVSELLMSDFEVQTVVATSAYLLDNRSSFRNDIEIIEAGESELSGLGSFQSNQDVMAVARMKLNTAVKLQPHEFALILDDIRDPGNLGTIIRIADWYGITNIIASEQSADFYNPKVISASMGSFCRVNVFYTSLTSYLIHKERTLYGTFLDGQNVHQLNFERGGFIVIGNEAHGISPDVERFVDQRISIPRFGKAESLNAAVATSIVLDNLRRSQK